MVAVTVRELTKVFDGGAMAVDHLDLDIGTGEFMVLLGPAASATTLLRLIGGLEAATSGEVMVDAYRWPTCRPGTEDRPAVPELFIYPHLTVAQNIGFPLRAGSEPSGDVAGRVAEAAQHLGIGDLVGRLPAHLSRGQRQRVAMARAIVRRPELLLLDEPLSNVDPKIWADLRGEIVHLTKRLGITTVYVTHDRAEAASMADRIAVLDHGALQWVGPAETFSATGTGRHS